LERTRLLLKLHQGPTTRRGNIRGREAGAGAATDRGYVIVGETLGGSRGPPTRHQQKLSQGKLGNSYNKKLDRRIQRGAEPTVKRGSSAWAQKVRGWRHSSVVCRRVKPVNRACCQGNKVSAASFRAYGIDTELGRRRLSSPAEMRHVYVRLSLFTPMLAPRRNIPLDCAILEDPQAKHPSMICCALCC